MVSGPEQESQSLQVNIQEMQARLNRLERHEWWRWALAFVIMLALTVGIFALSVPVSREFFDQERLSLAMAAKGLLGLVLLFDVFVIHQQIVMKRLRQELATQLGVINALESLRVSDDAESPRAERRRMRRSGLDRRLCVNSTHDGKASVIYGRIRDICEDGLGAVIPCSLHIGQEVTLQFAVDDYQESEAKAVVRHRKSFHYGFEFIGVDPNLKRAIARFVDDSAIVRAPAH